MAPTTNRYHVAVAASYGADILTYHAELSLADAERLKGVLRGLADLGHVASFAMTRAGPILKGTAAFEALVRRWGFVVDAVLASEQAQLNPPPAFLVPVWPFQHEGSERPVATARFLHLDLEVTASLTTDEEHGVMLPGRSEFWVVEAQPLLF